MKLVTYEVGGATHWGAVQGEGIIDLGARLQSIDGVRELLKGGESSLALARAALDGARSDHMLASVQLLPPVPGAGKIFCIGVNYAHRNAEYKDGSDLPKYPSIFMRVPGSLVGHGQSLLQPLESKQLDYEGEIVIVIGRRARRVSGDAALACIGGLTCMNEGTIRDWVHHAKFNVTQGKNFQASGSIGPWVVTADEFPGGYDDLRVRTRVNGELRQDDSTAHLMFPFAELIAYLSTFTELEPGDIIATGTPVGAGVRLDPPRYLQPGDVVEVEVAGVGVLSNTVRAEGAPT